MEEQDKRQTARILIVEDEPLFRELLENTLGRQASYANTQSGRT